MRLHILATALATAAALSIAAPAAAVTVPIDYSLSVTNGVQTASIGTMILDYDGSSYTLQSLVLSTPTKTTVVTSDVTLAPASGTDYCLYTFSSCSVVAQQNSLYFIFDPSLTSQTVPLYVYSTKDADTQSVSLIIRSVPEPATWAMMLIGFGAIGASMRWKRRRTIPVRGA